MGLRCIVVAFMIGIINYDSGNLRSVSKAFEKVGAEVRLVEDAHGLNSLDAVVLPGVGSFGDSVRGLQERGLWVPLKTWISEGNPFFGICLGYQLLFESSEESPGVDGFGIYPGKVVHFEKKPERKIPQMGWNTISRVDADSAHWNGLPDEAYFFFVHSYFPVPADDSIIASRCDYDGENFAASIASGRLVATQFHPEKSQGNGLRLIENFVTTL